MYGVPGGPGGMTSEDLEDADEELKKGNLTIVDFV